MGLERTLSSVLGYTEAAREGRLCPTRSFESHAALQWLCLKTAPFANTKRRGFWSVLLVRHVSNKATAR